MCKEIIKLKEEHKYDFSNYFDLNRIDDDAAIRSWKGVIR